MQFDKDLNSDQAELFLDVREFISQEIEIYIEKVIEKYSDNITTLTSKELGRGFCYIRTKDDYVHIGWFCGAEIVDRFDLLLGNGKMIRGHKIKVLDKINKEAIAFYVKETYITLVEKAELKKGRLCKQKN